MEQLAEQLNDLRGTLGTSTGVSLRAKMTRKKDEVSVGADLGLIVEVNLPQELTSDQGSLGADQAR